MNLLNSACTYEESIRKSRFIVHAAPVADIAATLTFFESVADAQANHNCWAWRVNGAYRFNDDGEPSGSAGRPIFSAIEGRDLHNVMVVVTRYFGGIKLGVGGLIRAYGGSAAKCLDAGVISAYEAGYQCEARFDFSLADAVHRLIDSHNGVKLSEEYQAGGLAVRFELPAVAKDAFTSSLATISRGKATLSLRKLAAPG